MKKAKGLAVRATAAALACALIAGCVLLSGCTASDSEPQTTADHADFTGWALFIAGHILVPVSSPEELVNVPGFPFRLLMAASVRYYYGSGECEQYYDSAGLGHILLPPEKVLFIAEACFGIDYMSAQLLRELAVNNGYPLRDGYDGECIDTTSVFSKLGSPAVLSIAEESGQLVAETRTDTAPQGAQIREYVYMRYTFTAQYANGRPVYLLTGAEVREAPPGAGDPYYVPAPGGDSSLTPPSRGASSAPRGAFSINEPLLALIGRPLSEFEHDLNEEYAYFNIGSGRDTVEYYNPFIRFNINSVMSGKGGPSPNPLISEQALVQSVYLMDEFDTEHGMGGSQSSLKRFFMTDEVITYALLCEELLQTPPLAHYPNSGAYEAVFELSGRPVTVRFAQRGDGYVAHAAEIGSGEYVM